MMDLKNLLISAVVIVASSVSASAMITDNDDNDQPPAIESNIPKALAVNPKVQSETATLAPAFNPNLQGPEASSRSATNSTAVSLLTKRKSPSTQSISSDDEDSNSDDEDPNLKGVLQFMTTAPDIVVDRIIHNNFNTYHFYRAVAESVIKINDKWGKHGFTIKGTHQDVRTHAGLTKIKALLDLMLFQDMMEYIIPPNLQPQEDTESRRKKHKIQDNFKAFIEEDRRVRDNSSSAHLHLLNLWVGSARPDSRTAKRFRIKMYLDSLPANTKRISLANRNLDRVPYLERFTELESLDLSNNLIISVKGLGNLVTLRELNLNNNRLRSLVDNEFRSSESLKTLVNLKRLHLQGNRYIQLRGIPKVEKIELYVDRDITSRSNPNKKFNLNFIQTRLRNKNIRVKTREATPDKYDTETATPDDDNT